MTDQELLHTALHGVETEWQKLYEACRDRGRAEALARALEEKANDDSEAAVAWAGVLADLHPGLKVNLSPARPSSA